MKNKTAFLTTGVMDSSIGSDVNGSRRMPHFEAAVKRAMNHSDGLAALV
ncbi:MAG: hypothetical protein ACHQ1H_06920 [Nitrososphaerales archaeon]